MEISINYLPPKKVWESNIFSRVCLSVCLSTGVFMTITHDAMGLTVQDSVAIWVRIDTIGKIELNPSFVLSSNNTNCKNDIQLFHQLFDELSVNGDYHIILPLETVLPSVQN